MKKLIIFSLLTVLSAGCSSQALVESSEFPLEQGTTWVYSYKAYQQSASDPAQIIGATYQLTETVVEIENVSNYFVAHVKREYKLIDPDAGWSGDFSSQPNEFWYIVNDRQVLQSNQPLDQANIKTDELILDYDFPLSVAKTWCLTTSSSKDPNKTVVGCEFVGKREVTSQGPYETAAENFADCYDMIDYWNTGNFFQKFCSGIGIVSVKFDHPGTRFGFEQTLISYSKGTP